MEDDDFNSVAWDTGTTDYNVHSAQSPFEDVPSTTRTLADLTEVKPPTSPPHEIPEADLNRELPKPALNRTSFTTFSVPHCHAMTVTVSEPQKEGDKDPYVTYLITTQTTLESFAHPVTQVRRRFQDFVWLKNALKIDFPACIIPPLPEKHSMVGYIVGDRFSPEFLEKRRGSLERYLERIARHPTLQMSPSLRTFLESKDFNFQAAEKIKNPGTVFDNLGDTLLNAFAKIKKKDERFVEMKETVDKLEENLAAIEKLYQRILKRDGELEQEYIEFGNAIMTLGTMETGMTNGLNAFAQTIDKFAISMKDMKHQGEFVANLREYLAYCHNAKSVLKLRDQKQLDVEELSDYLQGQILERERCLNPGRGGGGILSSIKDKYDEMKGVDQGQAKHDKLEKLNSRITELQEAVETSFDVCAAFSNELVKEFDRFEAAKAVDMKCALQQYTAGRVEFYRNGAKLWDSIVPVLERMQVED